MISVAFFSFVLLWVRFRSSADQCIRQYCTDKGVLQGNKHVFGPIISLLQPDKKGLIAPNDKIELLHKGRHFRRIIEFVLESIYNLERALLKWTSLLFLPYADAFVNNASVILKLHRDIHRAPRFCDKFPPRITVRTLSNFNISPLCNRPLAAGQPLELVLLCCKRGWLFP